MSGSGSMGGFLLEEDEDHFVMQPNSLVSLSDKVSEEWKQIQSRSEPQPPGRLTPELTANSMSTPITMINKLREIADAAVEESDDDEEYYRGARTPMNLTNKLFSSSLQNRFHKKKEPQKRGVCSLQCECDM